MNSVPQNRKVVLVNNSNIGGGGEKIVHTLWEGLNQKGYCTELLVGKKIGEERVSELPLFTKPVFREKIWRIIEKCCDQIPSPIIHNPRNISLLKTLLIRPYLFPKALQGYEIFEYPGFSSLISNNIITPDIIHLHNLHEDYFDLRILPDISSKIPVFLTIHDFWLITGYCASFFSCMEWKNGCHNCLIRSKMGSFFKNVSNINWLTKKEILSQSHLYLITPSNWTKKIIENSILTPAIVDSRTISHGIATDIFKPGDKKTVREILQLSQEAHILLMTSKGGFDNQKFDWNMLKESLHIISKKNIQKPIFLLVLGGMNRVERINSIIIKEIPFQKDVNKIVQYYQSADLYIHTSKDETFGMSILEAMSCGLPVITSCSGAIPEIVQDKITGRLISNGDSMEMANEIITVLADPDYIRFMSSESRKRALLHYSIEKMIDKHIQYYEDILRK